MYKFNIIPSNLYLNSSVKGTKLSNIKQIVGRSQVLLLFPFKSTNARRKIKLHNKKIEHHICKINLNLFPLSKNFLYLS